MADHVSPAGPWHGSETGTRTNQVIIGVLADETPANHDSRSTQRRGRAPSRGSRYGARFHERGAHMSSPIHTHYVNTDSILMDENMVVHDPIAILSNKAISWKGFF